MGIQCVNRGDRWVFQLGTSDLGCGGDRQTEQNGGHEMDADTGFHTLIFFVTFVVTIAVICAKMRIQDSKFSMILPICTADFFQDIEIHTSFRMSDR